jgi:cobalt-precorrin 5A hydrolase/precorrin-3B C17-methyltransferase
VDQNITKASDSAGTTQRPAIICLSDTAATLAGRIAAAVDGDVHGLAGRCRSAPFLFENAIAHVAALFSAGRPVIGLCASAILIRAVAPHLGHKRHDPPVIAIAEDASTIVPLLGLHHGGLRLGSAIQQAVGGHLAVTTPGNLQWGISLDAPPAGWRLANPDAAAAVMAALLNGAGATISGADSALLAPWLASMPKGDGVELTVTSTWVAPKQHQLVYCPQKLVLGVGCARGYDVVDFDHFVMAQLERHNINPAAIAAIASIDLKADEPAILALADRLDVPYRVFTAAALEAQTPRLVTPSETVFAEIGVHGVAEAAALAMAGAAANLCVTKQKSDNATLALAEMPALCDPNAALPGRKPGRVMLIGIGPGQAAWRTPEAAQWVQTADELVGYGLYIDILGSTAAHIPRADFALGEEEARCRYALERAATGLDVAIICSGDAGIYAMGALVFELLDRDEAAGGVSQAARRVAVVSTPGVSALQAAAARSGAILGHDFCTISLSDLLTPWPSIESRIHAAGSGDFVIAFYNPVSRRRRTQLAAARDILIGYRGADTPVVLASNLGRQDETLKFRTLGGLDIDEVDMLTVVMVGSSASRLLDLGRGKAVYTPRGYDKKQIVKNQR